MEEEYSNLDFVMPILSILCDNILNVKSLWKEVRRCSENLPRKVRRNVKEFENLLRKYPTIFSIENGNVVLYDPELQNTRENAIEYLQNILNDYTEWPTCKNFRGHIEQADEAIRDFFSDFYPGRNIKDFLLSCPEVFVIFEDDTVGLIEEECVSYFQNVIAEYGEGKYYMNLRGYIGQAPIYVMNHINYKYPNMQFLHFLEENYEVFEIDFDGNVYLC